MQQLDPPCQTCENAITPHLGTVLDLLKKTIKKKQLSIRREDGIQFPIFPLIWDSNEPVWKNEEGEVEVQPQYSEGKSKCIAFNH